MNDSATNHSGVNVDRVLLLAPQMQARGTTAYTVDLAGEYRRLGVQARVCCVPGPMLEVLRRTEVPFTTFDHLDTFWLHRADRRRLVKVVRDFSPQVVHGQSPRAGDALRLLCKGKAACVMTVHTLPERARILGKLSRCLSGVIASTQAVREGLVNQGGVDRAKIRVIHNGINVRMLDAHKVLPIFRSTVPAIGSLGPIEKERGHDLFVEAAAVMVRRGTHAQFVVAGDGREASRLRKQISSLDLDRCMTVVTDFASYSDVLNALDVVVQSALVDVSGFSILEAMGHGRPVIAFSTGTGCEIIEDGKTGMLVPKGDVEALAAAMERLLAEPETARQLARQAESTVRERLNIAATAQETLRYYAELL